MDQNQYQKRLGQLEHLVQEIDKSRQFWQISSTQAKERVSIAELRLKSVESICAQVEQHPDRRTAMGEVVIAISVIRDRMKLDLDDFQYHVAYDIWEHVGEVAQRMSDGWVPFGFHANYNLEGLKLDFDNNDLDEAGMPRWERAAGAFDSDDKYTLLPTLPLDLSMKPGDLGPLDE